MTKPQKDLVGAARGGGTVVDWLIRFWRIDDFTPRWPFEDASLIRNVTCRVLLPDGTPENSELWRIDGVSSAWVNLQPALDPLAVGQLYILELEVPLDSLCRSTGPAGPTTGRQNINDLPPWFHRSDEFDYQVRPIRFWFEVEDFPSAGPSAKRIRTINNDEDDKSKRPVPGRARLLPDSKLGVNHVEIDWRPDWLRRGRSPAIGPTGKYEMHGGVPTHVVLHATGSSATDGTTNIGAAMKEFISGSGAGGIHYIVDQDGHVVKLCPENRGLAHADVAVWRGKEGLNRRSVGIEHMFNVNQTEYPKAQMRASVDLVRALKLAFGIDGRNVAGHGEVRCIDEGEALDSACVRTPEANRTLEQKQRVEGIAQAKRASLAKKNDDHAKHGRQDKILSDAEIEKAVTAHVKSRDLDFDYDFSWGFTLHPHARCVTCPGRKFDWERFAARGIVPDVSKVAPNIWDPQIAYSGYFSKEEEDPLRDDDNDDARVWGGRERPDDWVGTPIRELHDDLHAIGYAIPLGAWNNNGHRYTRLFKNAIKAFKAHHMRKRYLEDGSTKARAFGWVDRETAQAIKMVADAYSRYI